jgi:hypothetical protein
MDASKVQLKTIFRSQSARAAFQSFLHHQFCEENILFYNAVEEYKKVSYLNSVFKFNLSALKITKIYSLYKHDQHHNILQLSYDNNYKD